MQQERGGSIVGWRNVYKALEVYHQAAEKLNDACSTRLNPNDPKTALQIALEKFREKHDTPVEIPKVWIEEELRYTHIEWLPSDRNRREFHCTHRIQRGPGVGKPVEIVKLHSDRPGITVYSPMDDKEYFVKAKDLEKLR
jgi:hypothetical protein